MPHPAPLVLAGAILAAGCVPTAKKPAPAPAAEEPATAAKVVAAQAAPAQPEPAKRAARTAPTARKTAPAPVVRDLDAAAFAELQAAFGRNPVAALDAYKGTRWRVRATYAVEIGKLFDVVEVVAVAEHVGQVNLYVRTDADAARVELNKPFTFEAQLKSWNPGDVNGATFRDATVR